MFYQKRENPGELRNPKNPWKSEKLGNSKILWIREKRENLRNFPKIPANLKNRKKLQHPGELEKLGK